MTLAISYRHRSTLPADAHSSSAPAEPPRWRRPKLYLVPPLPDDASDDLQGDDLQGDDLQDDGLQADEIPGDDLARVMVAGGVRRHGADGPRLERRAEFRTPDEPWAWSEPAVRALRPPRVTSRYRPVRLTRRGRIVVGALLLGLAVGAMILLAPASQAASPAGPARTIVVHQGDTMWSIASTALPNEDPSTAISEIRALNHLLDNTVYIGEQLLLPPS